MDKFEYKIRAEEIKALIAEGEFAEAVEIADTIDWRKVRSVMMLCTVSDLYKINRRYRESKDILLLAYERHPAGRSIVYSLCELSIKLEEYVQAIEYYKEFAQIAPKDTGRYILQYRLYEAQDVSLEERIEVLKEFKKHDYREKWAYELAYLYHRIGLATQCVEECDEMFIMFGEGKYIVKALELKALHAPLSPEQQKKYDEWMRRRGAGEDLSDDRPEDGGAGGRRRDTRTAGDVRHGQGEAADGQMAPVAPTMELPEVKTVDLGQYNTINLQMALAESMREILSDEEPSGEDEGEHEGEDSGEGGFPAGEDGSAVEEFFGEEESEEEEPEEDDELEDDEPEDEDSEEELEEEDDPEEEEDEDSLEEEEDEAFEDDELEEEDFSEEDDEEDHETEAEEFFEEEEEEELEDEDSEEELEEDEDSEEELEEDEDSEEEESEDEAFDDEDSEDEDFFVDGEEADETADEDSEEEFEEEDESEEEDSEDEDFSVDDEETDETADEEFPEDEAETEIDADVASEIKELFGKSKKSDGEDDEDDEALSAKRRAIAESLIAPLLEETARLPDPGAVKKKMKETPVISFPGKKESKGTVTMDTDDLQEISAQIAKEDTASFDARQILEQMKQEAQQEIRASDADRAKEAETGVLTPLNTKPSKYDRILSQEYDGQISLVVPEAERVEKQITGQLSIQDIMAEWEEMKKTNEQKRMEEVRQRILAHTGNLFADFDEATKNGLLEELERAFVAAIMKDSGKKSSIKKVALPEDEPKPTSRRPKSSAEEHVGKPTREELELSKGDADAEPGLPEDDADNAIDGLDGLEASIASAAEESAEEPVEEAELPRQTAGKKRPPKKAAGARTKHRAEEPARQDEGGSAEEEAHPHDRELTPEEIELFGQFAHHRKSKRQLIHTLDNMSLAPYTGNVIITGEEEVTTLTLAKALIKEMQLNDSNFSGKVAKITASVLNKKDVAETFARLDNGALIIEKASRLKAPTAAKMAKVLEKDNRGLLLLMIDTKQSMNQLLADHTALNNHFNLRVDIEPLDNEALVAYAKQYAEEMEYSIDEFGILALHTRIADRQTSDHEVSMSEVRDLVDEAIHYANKKTPKHFMDILLAKRYDEEDMIILREKDFMHY